MTQLLRKPFLLAVLLSLPLWVVFSNYIVALSVALLLAFLLSMLESLLALRRQDTRSEIGHAAEDSGQDDSSTPDKQH